MIRRILTWAGVTMFIFWLVTDPAAAGSTVHVIAHGLASAGASVGRFVKSL
jgi:hypothetical protein